MLLGNYTSTVQKPKCTKKYIMTSPFHSKVTATKVLSPKETNEQSVTYTSIDIYNCTSLFV